MLPPRAAGTVPPGDGRPAAPRAAPTRRKIPPTTAPSGNAHPPAPFLACPVTAAYSSRRHRNGRSQAHPPDDLSRQHHGHARQAHDEYRPMDEKEMNMSWGLELMLGEQLAERRREAERDRLARL